MSGSLKAQTSSPVLRAVGARVGARLGRWESSPVLRAVGARVGPMRATSARLSSPIGGSSIDDPERPEVFSSKYSSTSEWLTR